MPPIFFERTELVEQSRRISSELPGPLISTHNKFLRFLDHPFKHVHHVPNCRAGIVVRRDVVGNPTFVVRSRERQLCGDPCHDVQ